MRSVGHEPPDGAEIARRREPPGVHDEDGVGEPLHLFEDVRREEDRPARGSHVPEQTHHVQPLPRIHAVEGLVEQQDARLVDERPGELGALAHPLGIRADRAVGRLGQLDRGDRLIGGASRIGDALELGIEQGEFVAGQIARDRLALGHQPHIAIDVRVAERRSTGDAHDPRGRGEQTGEQMQQGRLAGAVGPQQSGHARTERERDVIDRHDVAVPAGDVVEFDRGHAAPAPARARTRARSAESKARSHAHPLVAAQDEGRPTRDAGDRRSDIDPAREIRGQHRW